ncbi:MAG: twin-arginine translocase subunit TatC [Microbacterium sp.]
MTLTAHLKELKRRLMIAAAALLVGMIVAFIFADPVIDLLVKPIAMVNQDHPAQLNFTTVSSGFDFKMRLAFALGVLVSAPIWLWQLWAFIMPGLTKKEFRYTIGFLASAIPLFFGGCVVGWLVMPHVIEVMSTFIPEQGVAFYQADYYFDFILKLLLVIGVSFVTPVFLVALNLAGIVSGRQILKGWRVAVVIATAFAAITTPAADITTMLLLAAILIVLYIAAALLSLLFDRRRRQKNPDLYA